MSAAAESNAAVAKWREDFLVIYRDVQDVFVQRHIYREVIAIAAAIPNIDELDQTVFEWIMRMHAQSAAVAVRKQDDRDKSSVSFRRLLEAIAAQPELLDRAEYIARSKPDRDPATELGAAEARDRRHIMDQRFDQLVGTGAAHLSTNQVQADLARLKAAANAVRPYVNLTIAHRSGHVPNQVPTWSELDGAIDLLEELIRKYNELLDAGRSPRLVPTWQYDWKAVFRIPWLPSDTDPGGRSSL